MSQVVPVTNKPSIIMTMAQRYEIDADELNHVIQATIMPANATQAEFMALLMVANVYKLNPMTREIYAFPKKGGGIVPVVSIDGWIRIVNERPDLEGFEFEEHNDDGGKLVSITCKIHRKGRSLPIVVTEYLDECIRQTEPWKMARRMLRHKSFIQCARYAFGFSGIYDEDEGLDMSGDLMGKAGRGRGQAPKPPGTLVPHDPNTGEIIDAEARDVTHETVGSASPENVDGVDDNGVKEPDPAPPVEEKKAEVKKETPKPAGTKAADKPSPFEELKAMIEAAVDLIDLGGIVAKDAKGKPNAGQKLFDKLSDEDGAAIKALYKTMKAKLSPPPIEEVKALIAASPSVADLEAMLVQDDKTKPRTRAMDLYDAMSKEDQASVEVAFLARKNELAPPVGDQQDGGAVDAGYDPEEALNRIGVSYEHCDSMDSLEACQFSLEETLDSLNRSDREKAQALYEAAEKRIKTADAAETDGAAEQQEEAQAAKDPATMTLDEYMAYAEAYIGAATDNKALNTLWFGEAGIRTETLKMPEKLRDQLRDLRNEKLNELRAATG